MRVQDIVTTKVVTSSSDINLIEIVTLMQKNAVGTVIIIDSKSNKNKPLGIITDRDVALKLAAFKERLPEVSVVDVMSKDLLVVNKNQTLNEAIIAMRKKCVRRAPVVDEEGSLAGIISIDDLLSTITNELCELQHLIKHQIAQVKCCDS